MLTIDSNKFYQKYQTESLEIIDVREKNEFQAGHILNSINLPLSTLPFKSSVLSKDIDYYLVCASGSRSNMAGEILSQMGYNVTNVQGGVSQWKGELVR